MSNLVEAEVGLADLERALCDVFGHAGGFLGRRALRQLFACSSPRRYVLSAFNCQPTTGPELPIEYRACRYTQLIICELIIQYY